jgi:hypothetical protein
MSDGIRGIREAFSKPAFVTCVIVLATSAIGLQTAGRILEVHFRKLPVPLQRQLDQLDTSKLLPEYEFVARHAIQPDVLGELGTDKYLNCVLRDTARPKSSRQGYARVFVTYYTGDPGQVPHVPDVCYLGGGFVRQDSRKLSLDVPALGDGGRDIPIRIMSFSKQGLTDQQNVLVLYVFSANGSFECDRQRLRLLLGDPRERYAYFSKVEVSISAAGSGQAQIDEGMKLLRKLLPVLVNDHWPDWEQVTEKAG